MLLPSTDTHFKSRDWDHYQVIQYNYAVSKCHRRRVAIDCGAHVGIHTHRMAEQFHFVHAFEPVWHYYLSENMEPYDNWELHTIALGAEPGTCSFRVNETNTGNTQVAPGNTFRVRTIDSYRFVGVDLIKMDLEGQEYPALLGAQETIGRCRPVLLLEIEPDASDRTRIEQLLADWGYTPRLRKNADTIWTPSQ